MLNHDSFIWLSLAFGEKTVDKELGRQHYSFDTISVYVYHTIDIIKTWAFITLGKSKK